MSPAIDELGIDENGCIKGTLCNESRLEEFHKACNGVSKLVHILGSICCQISSTTVFTQ